MLISISGYIFLSLGLMILALPLILVELSRPRDWLMGGLFLFLGLFLVVENDLLRGSINLFVISMVILYGKIMSEITQHRFYQLSIEEKKRIGSFERWFESLEQLGQISTQLLKRVFNLFESFKTQKEKSSKEKKWVHPELKEESNKRGDLQSDSNESNKIRNDSNKIRNDDLTENEENS